MDILVRTWEAYPALVDMLLYFFLFSAAARIGFAKAFPKHEGKILSVAVGLFLAASLTMAQQKLGFSVEKMGPVAAFILCGLVFLSAYKFIHHMDVSKPLAVFMSTLLALALARTVMPRATERFARENPLVVLLLIAGVLYWAWHSAAKFADKVEQRKPGSVLAKHRIVPDENTLRKEARFVKKRVKGPTKKDVKLEKKALSGLEKALDLLENKESNGENNRTVHALLDEALKKTNRVRQQCRRLVQLDDALRRYDWRWFKKTHSVNLSDLTPEQQKIAQEAVLEERKRVNVEEALEKLQLQVNEHVKGMAAYMERARTSLADGSAAGAAGWIAKAMAEEKKTEALESTILGWEKRLIKLVKRQLRTQEQVA
jgi:hypothetical protein